MSSLPSAIQLLLRQHAEIATYVMSITEEDRATVARVAASLGPSPPDDPVASAKIQALLQTYDQRYQAELRAGVRKGLNMVLPKEVAGEGNVTVFGHVPGVRPGAKFKDRGQLYVAGVHATVMKGIHAPAVKSPDFARGAYSVVMSGGYADDEDMGESFWYTGEGGIDAKSKQQIKDQSFDRGANAALRNNCESLAPLRVIRAYVSEAAESGTGGPAAAAAAAAGGEQGEAAAGGEQGGGGGGGGGGKKEKGFVYEGLYVVLQCKREPSKDGPLVCKFLMCGVPGHSTVNSKVEFNIFAKAASRGALHSRRLAGGGGAAHPAKRSRVERDRLAAEAMRKSMLLDIQRRYPGSVLQCEDVSGGMEAVPIPVINEVSEERLPACFQYTREYVWAPGVYPLVAPVLTFVDEEMCQFTRVRELGRCGVAFNRMLAAKDRALGDSLPEGYEPHLEEQYNSAGCLMVTDPCGLHECGDTCTAAACRRNKQLSNGVVLPLEVFMTGGKGWGVRCREPIPAGAFVCCYVGQLVTDCMAEVRKGADHYLFDLDFFTHVYAEIKEKGLDAIKQEIPIHKIPPVPDIQTVRQIQTRAAAAVRSRPQAASAAATTTTIGGADGGGAGAAASGGAGPSSADQEQQQQQPAAVTAATTASAAATPVVGGDGLMAPEAVAAAAKDLLASCRVLTAAEQPPPAEATRSGAVGGSSMTSTAPPDSAVKGAALETAAATAAEAAAAADPGAFYMQPIFARDDAGAAPAVAAGGSGAADGEEFAPILVIDARSTGNVGRFINHSCDGNLTIQAVFAGPYRNTLLYHVGLYACKDIPPMEELTYNYGYHSQSSQAGREGPYGMQCRCGAPNCVGPLM